ncbi:MAG: serine hydrolase [Acidobacteriota bacterium]
MKRRFAAGLCAAVFLMAGPGCAERQAAGDPSAEASAPSWEGVWVAEKRFGPHLEGSVSLHRSENGWVARLQGETVSAERSEGTDGSVSWGFDALGQGRFVGWQRSSGAAIVGHWIQPPGVVQNYPFATPLRLEPAGAGVFDGSLSPFPQEVSLNISMVRGDDSAESGKDRYRTFLRNPQRNLGVFFPIETATVAGDGIRFADRRGRVMAVGEIVVPGERFTLLFPRFGETFDFTRRSRGDAPGFYPRRSSKGPKALLRPAEIGDGWRTDTPRATGLDERPLAQLVQSIAAFEPSGLRQPYIHGLLVAHRGKLVLEEYFHGFHREVPHDSRSAGKSLTSVLLGIAIHRGILPSVDEAIYPRFGGVGAFANPDPRKERLAVRHLVTMTSGFDCDDDDYDSPGNEDVMQSQTEQPDWYRYTLDLPMVREPGEAGVYCTGGIHLIGGVLRQATGDSLLRFFQEELAEPMGIPYYQMNLSPTERGYMGGGIRLRPRDFLKLGQLYLDGGVWNGRRLVSEAWVEESAAPHASLNEDDDYGFAWWRRSYDVGGRSVETYYASGNGGQMLFVVPELDLVVMIHAGNYSDGATRSAFRDRYLRESILPAALGGG